FQAEDGIRDLIVTGVQTCALPILRSESLLAIRSAQRSPRCQGSCSVPATTSGSLMSAATAGPSSNVARCIRTAPGATRSAPRARSEERRVGKEWRDGGGAVPYNDT